MSRPIATSFAVLCLLACSSDARKATPAGDAGDAGNDGGSGGQDASSGSGGSQPDGAAPEPDAGFDATGSETTDARGDAHGDEADAGVDGSTGQRLRTITYRAADGAEQPTGIYDTELEQPCSFVDVGEATGEPAFLCLNAQTLLLAFRDENCTEPVGVARANCAQPISEGTVVLGIRPRAPGCGGIREYFSAGESTTADELYALDTGECEPVPAYVGRPLVALGELDPSPYVEGRLVSTVVDEDTGFEIVHVEGGGARSFYEYRISGTRCSEFSIGDRSTCLPLHVASAGELFSDDTCETPLAEAPALSGCPMEPTPKPDYAIYYERPDGCSRPTGLYSVGDSVEPAAIHYSSDECSAGAPDDARLYFSLGDEIGFETLPLFASEHTSTSGRLSAVRLAVAGDAPFNDTGYFYDNDLDIQCSARDTAGYGLRCLPEGRFPSEDSYFSDDTCSTSLRWLTTGGCNLPLGDDDIYFETEFDACQFRVVSGQRIEPYAGAIYEDDGGGCIPVTQQTLENRGHTVVELGAEIPLGTFAALERVGDG